jgi:hypothetical protein
MIQVRKSMILNVKLRKKKRLEVLADFCVKLKRSN